MMIYNITMDEEIERQKLNDMGLTEDIVEIVLQKKRELLKKQSIQIQPIPITPLSIPEPITENEYIEPEVKIQVNEVALVETSLQPILQSQDDSYIKNKPIWKRRLYYRQKGNI